MTSTDDIHRLQVRKRILATNHEFFSANLHQPITGGSQFWLGCLTDQTLDLLEGPDSDASSKNTQEKTTVEFVNYS